MLKSFDSLRRHALTLGRETSYGLGSGIIVAKPRAPFLCVWMNSFRNYNPVPWHWATYAVWTPHALAKELPHDVHVEEQHLQHPAWWQSRLLFDDVYDWSHNYAIHVWKRYGHVPRSPDQIKTLNTTLGEIMRYVYFGSKALILENGRGVDTSGTFGSRWRLGTTVDLIGHRFLEFIRFNQ